MNFNELFSARETLQKIGMQELPVKTSYKIAKLLIILEKEEELYLTQFNSIRDKYGQKDDNGDFVLSEDGNIQIIEGREEKCNSAIRELNEIEIDIGNITFSIEEFDECRLSAKDLYPIISLIEGEK